MAQSDFEGVITMTTTNTAVKDKASVKWYFKNGSSRMEFDSQAGEHHSQFTVISDSRGMDIVAQGQVTSINEGKIAAEGASLRRVSEADAGTVNGYACTAQVYTDGTNETTYWMASELPIKGTDMPRFLSKNMPTSTADGFPVKMEKRDAKGNILLTWDVVSVKTEKVSADKFDRK